MNDYFVKNLGFSFSFSLVFTINKIHDKIRQNTLVGKPKRAQLASMVTRKLHVIIMKKL